MDGIEWVSIERIGTIGLLLSILAFITTKYLVPLFDTSLALISKLSTSLDKQQEALELHNNLLKELIIEEKRGNGITEENHKILKTLKSSSSGTTKP